MGRGGAELPGPRCCHGCCQMRTLSKSALGRSVMFRSHREAAIKPWQLIMNPAERSRMRLKLRLVLKLQLARSRPSKGCRRGVGKGAHAPNPLLAK
jgi:hypothetical protein